MGTLEIRSPLVERQVTPTWPLTQRIIFRFAFAYLILFNVFGGNSLLGFLWDPVVHWVGEVLFQVEITFRITGSGDTTWDYVQTFCFLVVVVTATAVWSLLDRKRTQYERLHEWLRVIVRFGLAYTMISYGAWKVIPSQMPSPLLTRLLQPFGEASPMRLLWTFMGASPAYCIFTGIAEMVGGLLLTTRRTTLLGALVCVGVLSHVAMLNLCYDVPVKLLSLHLLAMSVFLILPDLRRLANLFLFQRRVDPSPVRPLFTGKGLHRTVLVLRTVFVVGVTAYSLLGSLNATLAYGNLAPRSPLYGIWNVEAFEINGQVRPPLLSDAQRWQRVIFDRPNILSIQFMNGSPQHYALQLDSATGTLILTEFNHSTWRSALSFHETEPGLLVLEGTFNGHSIRVTLRRADESQFLLISRGFHWISEVPFNR